MSLGGAIMTVSAASVLAQAQSNEQISFSNNFDLNSGDRLKNFQIASADSLLADSTTNDKKNLADSLLSGDFDSDTSKKKPATKFGGFYQLEGAYTIASPDHGSKLLNRFDLNAQGSFSDSVKWKVGGQLKYDAIYDTNNFYPGQVRKDQRFDSMLRENYLDISSGDWEFRLGRQHIVWGEVVGLFFADVVSARDMREFILPDFDLLRTPQWAARAEYFKNDFHLEAIWIPYPTVDNIGKPGAEFYAYPLPPNDGYAYLINDEEKPSRNSKNQNFGLRASALKNGWDISAFVYHGIEAAPTFYREVINAPIPATIYTPRHDKVTQYGGTVAQDFHTFVLKGEFVYNNGKNFSVTPLDDTDGVANQKFLDYLVGFEFPLPEDTRFNFQFFSRRFTNHDDRTVFDKHEDGVSFLLSKKIGEDIEPSLLLISALNRTDWMARAKVNWNFEKNWRMVAGADFFAGKNTGFFGQFDNKDRVYVEVRRSF